MQHLSVASFPDDPECEKDAAVIYLSLGALRLTTHAVSIACDCVRLCVGYVLVLITIAKGRDCMCVCVCVVRT